MTQLEPLSTGLNSVDNGVDAGARPPLSTPLSPVRGSGSGDSGTVGEHCSQTKVQTVTKRRYQLLLEAKPEPGDVDGVRRLRLALKRLSRSFGLRAITVRPEPTAEATGRGGGCVSEK